MLPFPKWRRILDYLRTRFEGVPVRFLGGPLDRAVGLEISEEEYMTAIPLNRLALIMQEAKLLVTVGNGMSHLSAAMQTPTFLFYQACLGTHYILPRGNLRMRYVHVDPGTVNPTGILMALKKVVDEMERKGYFQGK
jgi:ADP-heptose:LPS heptosyltransferase